MLASFPMTFMFCGVNEGYQGNFVTIKSPGEALAIVRKKLAEVADGIDYLTYPGKVVYPKQYRCPDGGEVITAIISSGDPSKIRKTGKYLQNALLQTSLSIATYGDFNFNIVGDGHVTRGFRTRVNGLSIDELAAEWHRQAEKNMKDPMYVTAGFYSCEDNGTVFIQAEANPKKSHLNSTEKIREWEQIAILVAQEVGKSMNIDIHLHFQDVYFTYLRKEKSVLVGKPAI